MRIYWDVLKLIVKWINNPRTLLTVAKSNKRLYTFIKNEVCLCFEKGYLKWKNNDGMILCFARGWYYNNHLEYERNFKNNIFEGIQQYWFLNGQLSYKSRYKNGKKDGVQLSWYLNGKLHYKQYYKNGIMEGRQLSWLEDGELISESYFVNGCIKTTTES